MANNIRLNNSVKQDQLVFSVAVITCFSVCLFLRIMCFNILIIWSSNSWTFPHLRKNTLWEGYTFLKEECCNNLNVRLEKSLFPCRQVNNLWLWTSLGAKCTHRDGPFCWKVRNYSARCHQLDKHEYTWAGPRVNLYLYWTWRLYGANRSLSFSGCSHIHVGLERTDLTLQREVCENNKKPFSCVLERTPNGKYLKRYFVSLDAHVDI